MLNIIIPVYNGANTIKRTLGSLLAQTNKKFIVTIVNDGSTDNTLNIIETFKSLLPIRIIDLEENHGVAYARQIGLESNECEFICFLDSDDMFMPYTVELYLREMRREFPEVLYTDFLSSQEKGNMVLAGDKNITWFHGKCYRYDFLQKYNITMPKVLYNEDSGFATVVHELAEHKAYVSEITYVWSDNPNSLTRSSKDFEAKSLSHYVNALTQSFKMIQNHYLVQSLPVFYCQMNNIYHYHMQLLFLNSPYLEALEEEIKKFFNEFWKEQYIHPNLLLFGFSQSAFAIQRGHEYLTTLTPIQWLSQMSGIQYKMEDFQLDEEEKENML